MKIVMLGDSGAGKSSLLHAMLGIQSDPEMTIGCTFRAREIPTDNGVAVMHLWDTCGQERFMSLTKTYLRGCKIIVLVIDPSKDIGAQIQRWAPDAQGAGQVMDGSCQRASEALALANSLKHTLEQPTVFIAVNKVDLLEPGQIDVLAEKFAQQRLYFTSATRHEGTQELYESIALEAVSKVKFNQNVLVKVCEDDHQGFCCR